MFLVLHRKVGIVFNLSISILSDFWTQSTLTHTALAVLKHFTAVLQHYNCWALRCCTALQHCQGEAREKI